MRSLTMFVPIREGVLIAAMLSAATMTLLLGLYAGSEQAVLVILPLVIAVCAAAGLVLMFACLGSATATVAFLFVLIFINDALFRVRDPSDLGLDWQNAMKFLLWASAAVIGVAKLGRSWRVFGQLPLILVLIWLGIALLSSIYSASPAYSFSTAFGALAMLLLAAGVSVTLSEKQALLAIAASLCTFVLVGWVVYFAVPQLGRSPFITADGSVIDRICGLAGQANALGCCLVVLLATAFLLWYRGHCSLISVMPLVGIALFTLLAADSRTALLAILVAVAAVLARRTLWVWGSSLLAISLGSVLVLGVPVRTLLGFTDGLSRSGDPAEMLTLTGRTEIWAFVWDKITLQPVFGYGYNSSKFILPQFLGLPGLTVDEAHNTWLQNLLGTGIVGTVPLVILIVVQLTLYVRSPDSFRDLLLFIILVWGITVAGAYGSTPTVMTYLVFMSHMSIVPARQSPRHLQR